MLERRSWCKVNLLLNILGKRPDGFHELETVMQPAPVYDRLTFCRVGHSIELQCNDSRLPVNSKNLVYRAASLFLSAAAVPSSEGVRIYLEKKIPLAAGLGGGSGNAAVALLALNELFGHPLPGQKLHDLAAELGSDVPFFLQEKPALGTGRGERIEALESFPALKGAWLVLAHPGFGVSTPWAYQQLAEYPEALRGQPGRAQRLIALLSGTLQAAAGEFYNSLEAPVLPKYPLLQLLKEFFIEQGAAGSLMSGSGSTIFAVAEGQTVGERLIERMREKFGPQLWATAIPAKHESGM